MGHHTLDASQEACKTRGTPGRTGLAANMTGLDLSNTNTVIILTSNIGASFLLNSDESLPEHSREVAREHVMAAVRSHFSPEFLNRLSGVVIMFNSLGAAQLGKICQKAMKDVKR